MILLFFWIFKGWNENDMRLVFSLGESCLVARFYYENKTHVQPSWIIDLNCEGRPYNYAMSISCSAQRGCICCVSESLLHTTQLSASYCDRNDQVRANHVTPPEFLSCPFLCESERTNKHARNYILNSQTQFAFAPAILHFKSSARYPLSDSR